ncbi:MAG: hypothetical protein H7A21_07950 [Spirochaetales bacterium]|nr:hypothetical protein [Spirochaetales bacterium]
MKGLCNAIVLVTLLLLIAAMYLFAEYRTGSFILLLALSGAKFALVALQFMEVRAAHPIYGIWLLILFVFFAGGAIWFS